MSKLKGVILADGTVEVDMPTLNDVCAVDSSTEYTAQFGALAILGRNDAGELFQVHIVADHAREESNMYVGNVTGDVDVKNDINTTFDTSDGKRVSVRGGRIVSICNIP